jgi:hypothetical protein
MALNRAVLHFREDPDVKVVGWTAFIHFVIWHHFFTVSSTAGAYVSMYAVLCRTVQFGIDGKMFSQENWTRPQRAPNDVGPRNIQSIYTRRSRKGQYSHTQKLLTSNISNSSSSCIAHRCCYIPKSSTIISSPCSSRSPQGNIIPHCYISHF